MKRKNQSAHAEANRRYRKKHAERLKAKYANRSPELKAKHRARYRKWYLAKADEINAKARAERERIKREDPEAHRAWLKKYSEHYYANRERILAQQKEYAEKHKDEIRIYSKEWWAKNKDRENQKFRKRYWAKPEYWRKRQLEVHEKFRDKILPKMRAKYWADPEKNRRQKRLDYVTHRESRLEGNKAWAKKNPGKKLAIANKHRALKAKAGIGTDRIAYARFVQRVRTEKLFACHWCKRSVPRPRRTIDHVIPLNRGGKDCVTNIVCACWRCNARKHDRMPEEWIEYLQTNGI